jgi:hypothetical protein
VAENHKPYPTRRARYTTIVVLVVGAVFLCFAGKALAQAPPHKATCFGTPSQSDPNLGGGGVTSYPRPYKVDGLKVKPMVQFTYPHQVMVQARVVGNALHGVITDFHVALVYTAPDGTENDCKLLKGALYSMHGSWVDDIITGYWWVRKPNKGDRVQLEVQVTVTNPKTLYTQQFGKITPLRIPFD